MEVYWENGSISPRILDLGTRWRWVVSFMSQPLYPQEKGPWYPLDRRLGGPQSRSGRGGEEKNSQPIIQPVAQRYTTVSVTLLPNCTNEHQEMIAPSQLFLKSTNSLCGEASNNYNLLIIHFNDTFLYMISSCTLHLPDKTPKYLTVAMLGCLQTRV
jgi:hypothetical protein